MQPNKLVLSKIQIRHASAQKISTHDSKACSHYCMFSSSPPSSSSTEAAWSAHHLHLIGGNCITALECTKLAALSFNLDGKLDPELGTGFFCIKFVSPFHTLVIWGRIKKFKYEWKLVLGGPGTQLSKKIWSWAQNYPHTIIALDPLGEQPWLRTLQKTNVRGNDWSRLPNDMLGNGCNIMAQIQSGFFGTAANVWIWRIKKSKWTIESFPSH